VRIRLYGSIIRSFVMHHAWSSRNVFLSCIALLAALFLSSGTLSVSAQEPTAEEKAKAAEDAKKKADALDAIKKDQPEAIYSLQETVKGISPALVKADSAWILVSSALVMLMVPGLALFYCGMVRRKNVLATMMHSMVALAIVGVYWFVIGYALAFGDPWLTVSGRGIIGFSPGLVLLKDVQPGTLLPNTNIPVYLHMLFQGMFAIITPALISGALAERIRFKPYCIFLILWVTLVYCPLAHCVWAMNWDWANTLAVAANVDADRLALAGKKMVGYLGGMDAIDFAGGTVVHIAAGFSSLAAILVLSKRVGYPTQPIHPNSMVLTLTGAGLLWFGWFGFNGGSALGSGELATSAFAATQVAAAAAGLSWMLAEWLHRGKPTALGLASGIVAGLVAVTPASGYVYPWGGLIIGLAAGVACYIAVALKSSFGYDDSLDAFGVHGVGGFLGAVLTGVFSYAAVNSAGFDGLIAGKPGQVWIQFIAAALSAVVAFVFSLVIIKVLDGAMGFVADESSQIDGLDLTEHGETGFDFGAIDMQHGTSSSSSSAKHSSPVSSPS
jgi:Amt family ammonium transporter